MPIALGVNNNIEAINTKRHLDRNHADLGTRLQRLSSGVRLNGSEDDASGTVISELMRAQITGLHAGLRNAEMGINMLQVADGSLGEVNAMLVRMREMAVLSGNATMNDMNREALEAEMLQLTMEIDRVAYSTTYNDQVLLTGMGNKPSDSSSTAMTTSDTTGVTDIRVSGSDVGVYTFTDGGDGSLTLGNGTVTQTISMATVMDDAGVADGSTVVANFDRLGINVTLAGDEVSWASGSYKFGDLAAKTIEITEGSGAGMQVGTHDKAEDRIEATLYDMRATGAVLNLTGVSIATQSVAQEALTALDQAIERVSQQRGSLGSVINRLESTIQFTENSVEHNTATRGSIQDTDMAKEVTNLTRAQVLTQTTLAMMTQANAGAAGVLTLLDVQ